MATTRQLEVLDAVASEGSVQKAARKLGISAASAAESLNRLEANEGKPLVNRQRTGTKLTPAGRGLRRRSKGLV